MESVLVDSAASIGLFALLFVALFLYELKTTREREKRGEAREDKLMEHNQKLMQHSENLAESYKQANEIMKETQDIVRLMKQETENKLDNILGKIKR